MATQEQVLSPEVAARLADLAHEMRQTLYQGDQGEPGAEGIPVWGTKFSAIETECLAVGAEMGRLMMEQAVAGQGLRVPPQSR